MAAGNHVPSFHFAQGNFYYSTSACTFSGSVAISANAQITTSNQVIIAKNITFTPPKGEVEVINLLGVESTSVGASVPMTGTFQNQIFDEKAWTPAKLTCTLIFSGHNDGSSAAQLPDFINVVTGTGQEISTTHHRHSFGDETASQVRVTAGCVFLIMKNSVEEVAITLNTPFVNLGDIKPTGSEGYYEVDVEISCLTKNASIEIKDSD